MATARSTLVNIAKRAEHFRDIDPHRDIAGGNPTGVMSEQPHAAVGCAQQVLGGQ